MPKSNEYLTAKECAQVLRVGHHKVLRWIDQGTLVAADVGMGSVPQYRIARSSVDQLVERLQHEPSTQAD
jgi:excisionase family DNA binding protein